VPKAKEPRPKFQEYIAYRDDTYQDPCVIIALGGRYHCRYGLYVDPVFGVTNGRPRIIFTHRRAVKPDQIVAQADTFLGIVVKVEQLIKREKAGATT
jgi:hypothetical protein